MFTINVADKHKVLSDLMNIFGKLHQKGFSDEQILNICHTFFKSEVEDNIDFCLKINKLESSTSRDKIDEPTLHFKINIDFINKVLKIQKAVESIRDLSSSIFTLDGEKIVLDSNTDILKGISNTEKPKQASLPEIQPEVNPEEVKKLPEDVEVASDEQQPSAEVETQAETEAEPEPEIEQISEEVVEVEPAPEIETIAEVEAEAEPEPEPEINEPSAELAETENIADLADLPPETEIAEIETETETEISAEIAESEPAPEPEIIAEVEPEIEIPAETELPADLATELPPEPEITDIGNEIAETEVSEPEISEVVDDLPPIPDETELPSAENAENLATEMPEITESTDSSLEDLGDLGNLDDLDFGIAPEESEINSPAAADNSDDILLEISDPTKEDIVALQEKFNQLEQQQ